MSGVKGNRKESKYKTEALAAARDLGYPKSVLDSIKKAKKDYEIDAIMSRARHAKFDQ